MPLGHWHGGHWNVITSTGLGSPLDHWQWATGNTSSNSLSQLIILIESLMFFSQIVHRSWQWHWDIGIGGIGTGPLALALGIAIGPLALWTLELGCWRRRWASSLHIQWNTGLLPKNQCETLGKTYSFVEHHCKAWGKLVFLYLKSLQNLRKINNFSENVCKPLGKPIFSLKIIAKL